MAEVASDIAEAALQIAAADMTVDDATKQLLTIDVNAADPADLSACAYAATVEVFQPGVDLNHDGRTLTVAIDGGNRRALTVTHQDEPVPASPHTVALLLHHLGKAVGTAIPAS
jgi:hypothetical protein